MIASRGNKANMLDSLDPRAGALKVSQFIKQEGEDNAFV